MHRHVQCLRPVLSTYSLPRAAKSHLCCTGRKSAGGKREDAVWEGEKWGTEDRNGALLPLQSRVRPHSFICSAAEALNLGTDLADHPLRVLRAGSYMGRVSRIVHTRALWMWRSSDSQFDSEMSEMDALSPQKSMHFVIQLLNCWQLYHNAWTCERDEKFEQLSLF